ncbi:MAG: glycosyltransferase family 4 protein [Candidatus Omnitrophota bacterium]
MIKKKKILFIITHLELGGAQKQLLSIVNGLDNSQYLVCLFAGKQGYLQEKFLKSSFFQVRLIPQLVRNINPVYDFIAFLKLYFYIRKNKFYIVHTHSPKASILGRWAAYFAGVKNIVYTVHGWPFHGFMNSAGYYLYLVLEKITAKITKKIIVVSNSDLQKGVKNKIAKAEKFSLIHYGIDIDKFENVYKERKKLKPKNTILTISALKPQKGLFYFLGAAKMLLKENPKLNFIIAGAGPFKKKIEKRIRLLGLSNKVRLEGWVDNIEELFKKASVFVLTSLWEGLPISLIEAVSSGVPIVVSDTEGLRDLVKDKQQGFIVQPGDSKIVKEKCWQILKSSEDWSRVIEVNRNRINLSYWSEKRMIKEIEGIYAQL